MPNKRGEQKLLDDISVQKFHDNVPTMNSCYSSERSRRGTRRFNQSNRSSTFSLAMRYVRMIPSAPMTMLAIHIPSQGR